MNIKEYYKSLGLTKEQVELLSIVTFNKDNKAKEILDAYYQSNDYQNKVTLSKSIMQGKERLTSEDIEEYINSGRIERGSYRENTCPFKNDLFEDDSFGNTSFGNTPFGNTPFGNTPFGNTSFGNTPFGNTPFGNTSFGNTSFGNTSFGNTSFGNTSFGNTSLENDSFGNTPFKIDSLDVDMSDCECDMLSEPVPMMSMMQMSITPMPHPVSNYESHEQLINNRGSRKLNIFKKREDFKDVLMSPTSTFRTTCNTSSIGLMRHNGVYNTDYRVEELLNYFRYTLDKPDDTETLKITTELYNNDINNNKMLFIGVQGKEIIPKRQNIVILLDISGSMSGSEELMQASIITIASKLNKGDKLSLIGYSDKDVVILRDITIGENSIDNLIERLYSIEINGCTYGSLGLQRAYELITKNKIIGGINRVVVLTDGDFNFGIVEDKALEDFILNKRNTGAYLSIIGTGTNCLNDSIMSTLARNGNGNYTIINDLYDVDRHINKEYNKLIYTIAKDVKAQIEFNPKLVKSYKQIGYETRQLNYEDFKDDKVVAEPFSCGGYCIALYELEMQKKDSKINNRLKYVNKEVTNESEICTINVRYKEIEKDEVNEIEYIVNNRDKFTTNSELAHYIYKLTSGQDVDKVIQDIKESNLLTQEEVQIIEKIIIKGV